jgi:hypothetical protein
MKEIKVSILVQIFGVYTVRLNLGHHLSDTYRLYDGKVTVTRSPDGSITGFMS